MGPLRPRLERETRASPPRPRARRKNAGRGPALVHVYLVYSPRNEIFIPLRHASIVIRLNRVAFLRPAFRGVIAMRLGLALRPRRSSVRYNVVIFLCPRRVSLIYTEFIFKLLLFLIIIFFHKNRKGISNFIVHYI